jgi:hypothetical protein
MSSDLNNAQKYVKLQQGVLSLYGLNSRCTEEDRALLTESYTKFFQSTDPEADPLELQAACERGETAQFIGRFVNLRPRKRLERLMRNKHTKATSNK